MYSLCESRAHHFHLPESYEKKDHGAEGLVCRYGVIKTQEPVAAHRKLSASHGLQSTGESASERYCTEGQSQRNCPEVLPKKKEWEHKREAVNSENGQQKSVQIATAKITHHTHDS